MTEDELYLELEPLARSLDLDLVDCRMQQTRFGVAVQLVVYRKNGLGTDDCAKLHRMVAPRLELMYEDRDLRLEVTSPGLDRKFRTEREYLIFAGRGVHIICKDGREWRGILKGSDGASCTIGIKGEEKVLPLETVAKVKLDYTEEGGTPWA